MDSVNWEALAREMGLLTAGGERCSTDDARHALAIILGDSNIKSAVDHFVLSRPGQELVRLVLGMLESDVAMQHCYVTYSNDNDIDHRRAAVDLLRHISDRRVLKLIPVFWRDSDESVQNMAAGILDQLIFARRVNVEDAELLIREGEAHDNAEVRRMMKLIRESAMSGSE